MKRFVSIFGAVALVTTVLFGWSNGVLAGNQDGGTGNNGVVMIDGIDTDDNGNDPFVPCTFDVTFWNYDVGAVGDVIFTAQSPTGNGDSVLSDLDFSLESDAPGGGDDLDATRSYDLAPYLVPNFD
ncbi:MAG TPA: hypothetical protein VI916_14895, partial [Acidimicrobiia bacterium]|nr:hypothetical protein [Acidimicrobiia bacterium]